MGVTACGACAHATGIRHGQATLKRGYQLAISQQLTQVEKPAFLVASLGTSWVWRETDPAEWWHDGMIDPHLDPHAAAHQHLSPDRPAGHLCRKGVWRGRCRASPGHGWNLCQALFAAPVRNIMGTAVLLRQVPGGGVGRAPQIRPRRL